MAEPFDLNQKFNHNPTCIACESLLADALDDALSPAGQTFFQQHLATCARCAEQFSEAQRGAAWLELLKDPRPQPSAGLLTRILAKTETPNLTPNLTPELPLGLTPEPGAWAGPRETSTPIHIPTNLLPFRPRLPHLGHSFFQPRLAMTAAMAFFSLALTLSLTGVHLDQLHASTMEQALKPQNLKKSYYQATAKTVRSYESLRLVRVLESRVDDLRNAATQQDSGDQPAQRPANPQGSSLRQMPSARPQTASKEGGLA